MVSNVSEVIPPSVEAPVLASKKERSNLPDKVR